MYSLGFVTAIALAMATANPMKDWYATAVHFNLSTATHVVDGVEFGEQKTAALKYWRNWQHVFERQKAEIMMLPWAEKGVVGAMNFLANFHRDNAYTYRWWPHKREAHAEKARYWAREAAAYGSANPISAMLLSPYAEVLNPTPDDIAIVKKYAQVSRGAAFVLSVYYEGNGTPRDVEQANYWKQFEATHSGFLPGPVDRPTPTLTEEQILYR